jgi:hypothetical protein
MDHKTRFSNPNSVSLRRKNRTGDLVSPASHEIENGNQPDGHRSACHSPELEAMSTVKKEIGCPSV